MPNVLQTSVLRGTFRKPVQTISTTDVKGVVRQIRPNPISVVWDFSGANVDPNGGQLNPGNSPPDVNALLQTLSTTGPGTLYISGPSAAQAAGGVGTTILWLNTATSQSAGVGNWVRVFSQSSQTSGASGGGGDGSGGGDGGDGGGGGD